MSTQTAGLNCIKDEISKIRKRVQMYTIFNIPKPAPVEYRIVKSGGVPGKSSIRSVLSLDEYKDIFEECRSNIDLGQAYFIAYDFNYFNEEKLNKAVLCLISYVPDTLMPLTKVLYASNALNVKSSLDFPLHIPFNNPDDFNFENILQICSKFKKN